jgi:tetratricopeptide (TPR) repeat protein
VLCWNAAILTWMGKFYLATERAQLAFRLGPFDSLIWTANHALSIGYFRSRRYSDAAEAAQNVVEANPVYSVTPALLATALIRLGRFDEARAMARTVLEREPSFTIRGPSRVAELDPAVFTPFADARERLSYLNEPVSRRMSSKCEDLNLSKIESALTPMTRPFLADARSSQPGP